MSSIVLPLKVDLTESDEDDMSPITSFKFVPAAALIDCANPNIPSEASFTFFPDIPDMLFKNPTEVFSLIPSCMFSAATFVIISLEADEDNPNEFPNSVIAATDPSIVIPMLAYSFAIFFAVFSISRF